MIMLKLTEQMAIALTGLLDGGVRHIGIRAAREAGDIFTELERAVAEAKSASAVSQDTTKEGGN